MNIRRLEGNQNRANSALKRLLTPLPAFNLHMPKSIERIDVEHYIAEQFRANYAASVSHFMPFLMTLHCSEQLSAVAGLQSANNGELFLEQYLPNSIEQTISQHTEQTVSRDKIIEIGNLAATHRGCSQLLFLTLTAVLNNTHAEWVVFTATPQVQKLMHRLNLELHTLGVADQSLLHNSSDSWGSYYDTAPQIAAVNIHQSMQTLMQHTIYSEFFSLYQSRINTLSTIINNELSPYEHRYFAA